MKNLSSLTSDSPASREAAILHSNRAPDVMTPAEAVLSDDDLARQWQMRYSEDNVKMPGFQINDVITIVMGMPVLVFICVTKGSGSTFLLKKYQSSDVRLPSQSAGCRLRPSRLTCTVLAMLSTPFTRLPCLTYLRVMPFSARGFTR